MVSPRFDYGSFTDDDVMIKSPSVKMLSLSSADDDYPEFLTYRDKNLASLPKEATKADVQKLIAQEGSSSGGDDGSSDAATSDDSSILSSSSAAATSSDDNSYQALIDKLNTFGPVVIGLLGAIFVTLLGLLAVSVTMCIRRGRSVGAARSAPSYAPVPERFKESEYRDDEHARYNE